MLSLIHQIAGKPWAIRKELALHVQGLFERRRFAELRHFAELRGAAHAYDDDERPRAARGRSAQPVGTVAVIPIIGTMTQRGDYINSAETRSTAAIADEARAAAADPKVDAVVLELDSPGGEVYGVPEAWQALREVAKVKPVVASVNSLAASAGYYLASASTEVWITPSGEAGSVGVYALHINAAKALEDMGEEWEFIEADDSPFKTEGHPAGPLTDDARAEIKKAVNRYMGMFVRDLARGRGVSVDHVRQNFGKGRMLGPQEAVAANMADHVGTLEQAIRRASQLGRERREGAPARAASAVTPDPAASAAAPPTPPAPTATEPDAGRSAAAALLGTL